jgi:uncharacterized lipoprotein YajG
MKRSLTMKPILALLAALALAGCATGDSINDCLNARNAVTAATLAAALAGPDQAEQAQAILDAAIAVRDATCAVPVEG